MRGKKILVVDDEKNIGISLRMILEGVGCSVDVCGSAAEFKAQAGTKRVDAYLLDVRLPDGNGIDLLRLLRRLDIPEPVIMISGHGTIADAVEATRAGAFDFLEKPLSRDRLLVVLKNALGQADLVRENSRLREIVGERDRMIGSSPAFLESVEQAAMVARSDARILLTGESGTGKELLASYIHHASPFKSGPFVKVNCAAIPTDLIESELFGHEKGAFTGATSVRRGKFELADGGSIFLDEVGDLHEASQAKLLRILQDGELQRVGGERSIRVSVRVVSATNRDLSAMVERREFREDLFYRLSVVPIRVPPLRERIQDIRELASYFLDDFCRRNNFRARSVDEEVFEILRSYAWPGNVRELKNAVERMAILAPAGRITAEMVPLEIRLPRQAGASSLQEARESAERELIRQALESSGWNVSRAARTLGVERTALHKRIRALHLGRGRT